MNDGCDAGDGRGDTAFPSSKTRLSGKIRMNERGFGWSPAFSEKEGENERLLLSRKKPSFWQ
jgi:hypothetical protein